MIGLDSQARIWLCNEPTDMRKSFRGLSALVRNQLKHDPLCGQYFVFVNRRKTQMKMLCFTATGLKIAGYFSIYITALCWLVWPVTFAFVLYLAKVTLLVSFISMMASTMMELE
ncbi:IS66 family insertion sequence element accessory protein TnpB [Marinobacter sp. 1-4A]|uniref:IS66 family insertion sequence element accessory protein TnpB n=1 Tax=Marinobacter sp. 1-4A TaxID=2582919 RepID=UPI0019041AD5|nr:IS66 family insertion sequence element accessory protein TnpB [Marinobacter sp. 1-4A]MBK1850959.1 IS66 family insertion sequence element accessory protein TnpB [Marinobacter sp. 1-4A]